MILKKASAGVGDEEEREEMGKLYDLMKRDYDHRQSREELSGRSLTRSRRFVNIQFRSGLIANREISFLVITRSSFGRLATFARYSTTHSFFIRVKHQLRSDLRIKFLCSQMPKHHRRLFQRRPFLMSLFRALGHIYINPSAMCHVCNNR